MMSDVAKELFFEVAERDGWLDNILENRELENTKKIAGKFLLIGRPIEEVVKATELPYETLAALKQS